MSVRLLDRIDLTVELLGATIEGHGARNLYGTLQAQLKELRNPPTAAHDARREAAAKRRSGELYWLRSEAYGASVLFRGRDPLAKLADVSSSQWAAKTRPGASGGLMIRYRGVVFSVSRASGACGLTGDESFSNMDLVFIYLETRRGEAS